MKKRKVPVDFPILLLLLFAGCLALTAQERDRTGPGDSVSSESTFSSDSSFRKRYPTKFLRAVATGQESYVDLTLHGGLSPNVKDGTEQRLSPIFVAILHKRNGVLKVLLRYKANLEVKDEHGITPLMAACYVRDVEAVRLLLDAGAKVNGIETVTPLMIAARYRDLVTLNELIRRGADLELRTDKGATALMIAGDDAKIVEALSRGKIEVNAIDSIGWTALHHAIDAEQLTKIEALVKTGARQDLPDKSGVTARQLAEQVSDPSARRSILDLLQRADAR